MRFERCLCALATLCVVGYPLHARAADANAKPAAAPPTTATPKPPEAPKAPELPKAPSATAAPPKKVEAQPAVPAGAPTVNAPSETEAMSSAREAAAMIAAAVKAKEEKDKAKKEKEQAKGAAPVAAIIAPASTEAATVEEGEHTKEPAPPKLPQERPMAPSRHKPENKVERKDPAPPSLTLEALRAEINDSPAEIERNNLLKERERIGELAGALDIAQKQLRADTDRLAAYLEEVRTQTSEIKEKRQLEKEAAKKAEVEAKKNEEAKAKEAKVALGPKAPEPPTPLEVLSKAMRGMKPAQAAAITERLPLTLAGDLMERMPARDAGKVMGLMNPEKAAALTAEIAAREERRKHATK